MKMIVISNTVALNTGDEMIMEGVIQLLEKAIQGRVNFRIFDDKAVVTQRYNTGHEFEQNIYATVRSALVSRVLYRCLGHIRGRACNDTRIQLACWMLQRPFLGRVARLFLSSAEYRGLSIYRDAELIAATGGTYLVEQYNLAARMFDLKVCRFLNKKTIFFTQSMGPFTNETYIKTLRPALKEANLVLLRGEQSVRNLCDIDVHGKNIRLAPDAAFALAPPKWADCSGLRRERIKVAVSVRDWNHFKTVSNVEGMAAYSRAIVELVEWLVASCAAEVTFISTCQGKPEYRYDDSQVADTLWHRLSDQAQPYATVDRNSRTALGFMRDLEAFDLLVATRMHAAIAGLCVGLPVVAIAYEFKTHELYSKFEIEEYVLDIEQVDNRKLIEVVDSALQNIESFRDRCRLAVENEKKALDELRPILIESLSA